MQYPQSASDGKPDDCAILFYHDYLDPHSFVVEMTLADIAGFAPTRDGIAAAARALPIERFALELLPPDSDPNQAAAAVATVEEGIAATRTEIRSRGITLAPPRFLPWTRKAHELVFIAEEHDRAPEVHAALLFAHHVEGRDIGRVDVLVELVREWELPWSATKASLDVDRLTNRVLNARAEAERSGVRGVPTLLNPQGHRIGTASQDLRRALEIGP
jgi:predicted DsbA family dithiol-disulfide isomerase